MPLTQAQGETALKYVVMNQPEDGPMAKSIAEAMIENVEDLGSLIESDIENLTFIAADMAESHRHQTWPPRNPASLHCLHQVSCYPTFSHR
jgi:hypothetical protein